MLPKGQTMRSLLVVITVLCILVSCSPVGLPEKGKIALDKSIAELASAEVGYRIVSAQKAPGAPEERRIEPKLPSSSEVYGCPPDLGDRETWCVVISQPITGKAGRIYSHFLLRRIGNSWYVEELTDAEADKFAYVGCGNWDVMR